MKLIELFEQSNSVATLAALKNKLEAAKIELTKIKSKGATTTASVVAPQYKDQYDRAKKAVEETKREIERFYASQGAEETQRAAEKERVEKKAAETPEQKKERFGKSVGEGLKTTNQLRKEYGDWSGLAKKVHSIYTTGSDGGQHKVSADYIADKLGTTNRTVNRWLEREEFTKTARLMGRR
jgi:hypothetical protein